MQESDLLTLIYVVHDEILTLPESLHMMDGLTDNIVVLDTGSKDGTYEWCKSRKKIRTFQHQWEDNFSIARNLALSYCDTPFALMLDADEIIDKNHFGLIHSLILNEYTEAYRFKVLNFLEDPRWVKSPKILYGETIRLFRNSEDVRYNGRRVHEKLQGFDPDLIITTPIQLLHFQFKTYLYKNVTEKGAYYRALIDMDSHKNYTAEDCIHIANTYREKARFYQDKDAAAEAIVFLKKALVLHGRSVPSLDREIKLLEDFINGKK